MLLPSNAWLNCLSYRTLPLQREAIDVNQDYAGFSGSLFAESSDLVSLKPCGGNPTSGCEFPATQSWYKPLSGRDVRRSVMAVLLVNNAPSARNLSFAFNQVPGLKTQDSCDLYDVWAEEVLATKQYGGYTAPGVEGHGSIFLKLSNCMS